MPAPKTTPENRASLATYWFAKLSNALEQADYILATEARNQLSRLGYDVKQRKPHRAKGGAHS